MLIKGLDECKWLPEWYKDSQDPMSKIILQYFKLKT